MVKQAQKAEINTFIQGLVTEASPLNFPPNASLDEQNFEALKSGTRERRLGIDFEDDYLLISLGISPSELESLSSGSFRWINAGGEFKNEFFVVQFGNVLRFFDSSKASVSRDGQLGTIELKSFPQDVGYSFSTVDGNLVVVCGHSSVITIKYDVDTGSFSQEEGRVKVRDLWGVEVPHSEYETNTLFRASTAPVEHIYNLRNQSWAIPRRTLRKNTAVRDVIDYYRTGLGVYPSNSEVVWSGIIFSATNEPPGERFHNNIAREVFGADTSSSRGHYIIDLLDRGASRLTEVQNSINIFSLSFPINVLPSDQTVGGPRVVEEYSGRVWYGGFGGKVIDADSRSPDLSSYLAFSQLVSSSKDVFNCYQQGDPSSRDSNDIVDTDGGFIRLSGASEVLEMKSLGRELIVLAKTGVWVISGPPSEGFKAANYEAKKLTSNGCFSAKSVVVEGDRLYYWGLDGIYLISRNEFGDLETTNISEKTIQSYFESISSLEREFVVSNYDPFDRRVRWLFKESDGGLIELIFDVGLGSFYKNKIFNTPLSDIEILSLENGSPFTQGTNAVGVVTENVATLSDTVEVVMTRPDVRSGTRSNRYFTLISDESDVLFTFSIAKSALFKDWESHSSGGTDAEAFLLSGEITAGDSSVHKQVPYLVMHFVRTEDGVSDGEPIGKSSCLVRSQWDWANSAASGKWSPSFQAYRYKRPLFVTVADENYDSGFKTIVSRNKIRGRGRAFSFYIETEPLRDCRIIGWALDVNGNSKT